MRDGQELAGKPRIPYTRPSITELEVAYATDAAANGWGSRCYEYIEQFENSFKAYLEITHTIATSSCTGALHMGMAALGIGPGDEVILADTNWIATAAPIVHLGAKPVFVDILPESWCIDPSLAEAAITPRTKAIVAVHLYGNLCEMGRLLAVGRKHGIPIIEDAAEAIGSIYQGKHAGSIGRFGTFSFHGTKTVTTGEGGMFVTDDDDLYEKVLTLSNHGRASSQTEQFWPNTVGFKYKMSNIQAAIGCAQMERIDHLVARKREIFDYYRGMLMDLSGLSMNYEPAGSTNGFWMPTIAFEESSGLTRKRIMAAFEAENIDARIFFHPLSATPPFEGRSKGRWASDISNRAINIPSFHDISEAEQHRVAQVIRELYSA
ncbi:glutamine--scyllo-inositol aminotransferase [Mycobacterium sp. 852002-51971_SCH5477799-a]|nr:glutamine--scyllo-inositol aminotransferase [Mycobacterium sp. 852002-51971_SCH5477799-a]